MDQIFYDAQRQGRISFYMTSYGEEAETVGSAAALHPDDMVFAQYRETGVFLWRGFTLSQFANQCFSNEFDIGKGRQMPMHFGSSKLNIQTISSPLATQIPQASGAAYAYKRAKKNNVVVCYFGEGAASEGDFHAALNSAATLGCPVVFICRNNGYAISTPTTSQYHGDGIASRAIGYGMHYVRVDGNDILAVMDATRAARKTSIENNVPVLVELMSYRAGHHSTSDDSTRYRSSKEIQYWLETNNPITRTRFFLESKGWWDSDQEAELLLACRKDVLAAFNVAEHVHKPPLSALFTDVYSDVPPLLKRQKQELEEHLAEYHDKYDVSLFAETKKA